MIQSQLNVEFIPRWYSLSLNVKSILRCCKACQLGSVRLPESSGRPWLLRDALGWGPREGYIRLIVRPCQIDWPCAAAEAARPSFWRRPMIVRVWQGTRCSQAVVRPPKPRHLANRCWVSWWVLGPVGDRVERRDLEDVDLRENEKDGPPAGTSVGTVTRCLSPG